MANFLIDSTAANPKTVGDIQQLLDSNVVHDGDIIVLKGTFSQSDTQFLRLSKSVTLRGDANAGDAAIWRSARYRSRSCGWSFDSLRCSD